MDDLEKMLGQSPVEISGMSEGSEKVTIRTREGGTLTLTDPGDYSTVRIVQVDGDPIDLLGSPLRMCEVVSNDERRNSEGEEEDDYESRSFTWTFIKFATVHGYVTLRWLGESSGYYSEEPEVEYEGPEFGPKAKVRWA